MGHLPPPLEQVIAPNAGAEHDEFIRVLAEIVPQPMWTGSCDGAIDYVNERWVAYTGVSLDQARGTGWLAVIHPEDRERVGAQWKQALETGTLHDAVYRIRQADDTYRWFVGRVAPIRDAEEQIVKWLGTAIDIDDQTRTAEIQRFLAAASEELGSSLDYHETLRRFSRLAVPQLADWCAVDLLEDDGMLRRVTVAHCDPNKEALAHELVERYPRSPDDPHDGLYRAIRTRQAEMVADIPPTLIEAAARDPEHLRIIKALQLRSYIVVPLIARDRVLGVLTLIAAESGRRYAEHDLLVAEDLARRAALAIDNARLFGELQRSAKEIRQLNERLEARVSERTAELEEVNAELESFCYSVSHDLRAPLRHIIGFAQLLARRAGPALDQQSRGYVETITDAATQGAKLIDDLLDFARLGRTASSTTTVDLAQLVAGVQRGLAPEAEDREVSWRVGELPLVEGDPALLRIALENLLGNALKYTRPRPEAVIEISAVQRPEAIELCVRDNGVGFEQQYVDKLFGVFQRLHTNEEFEGTGIGLATVRRIVARHGGQTWAEGAVDHGAAFFLTLPRTTEVQ